MQPLAFCSVCGHRISQLDTASACLHCGIIACNDCANRLNLSLNTIHGPEDCTSKLKTIAEWRTEIISELIDIRRSLKNTALRPVFLNKRWLEVQEFLANASQKYYIPRINYRLFESVVDTDQFILENLQFFANEIRKILQIISIDEGILKIDEYVNVWSLFLKYLASNVKTFDNTIQEWLSESERTTSIAEKTCERIDAMDRSLRGFENAGVFLRNKEELIVSLTWPILLKTQDSKLRVYLLITTERVIFIQPKIGRRQPARIFFSFNPREIILCDIQEKWRRTHLKLSVLKSSDQEYLKIYASESDLSIILRDLNQIIYGQSFTNTRIEPIRAWEIENFQDEISSVLYKILSEIKEESVIQESHDFMDRNKSIFELLETKERQIQNKINANIQLLHDIEKRFQLNQLTSQEYFTFRSNLEQELQELKAELKKIRENLWDMNLGEDSY
ncbi:MAG: hypothetical protein ACFFCZ_01940 [Promethearchaeota archaeon]